MSTIRIPPQLADAVDEDDYSQRLEWLPALPWAIQIASDWEVDTAVLPARVRLLIRELRALGDHVEGRGYPGADHAGVVAAAAHDTLIWLNARLRRGGFSARQSLDG